VLPLVVHQNYRFLHFPYAMSVLAVSREVAVVGNQLRAGRVRGGRVGAEHVVFVSVGRRDGGGSHAGARA